jgi:Xaa-Pro aminopeptidase
MFEANTYIERRNRLKKELQSGILLFLGNDLSPMNYPENTYPFRQDSTFLYFWGINLPGLAAIIDIDADREILFGRDPTLHDSVWTFTTWKTSAKTTSAIPIRSGEAANSVPLI